MSNDLLANHITAELNATSSDRVAAVLGGSLIEGLVKNLLSHVLVSNKNVKNLIASAEANELQTIAFSMGLLPADLYTDLRNIAKIRNKFAHTIEAQTFDQPEIANIVTSLIAPSKFGNIQGVPVKLSSGEKAKKIKDLPLRNQFISAVIAASVTLQHIQDESAPFIESKRFYVDPKTMST